MLLVPVEEPLADRDAQPAERRDETTLFQLEQPVIHDAAHGASIARPRRSLDHEVVNVRCRC
jgi:hypothetical protein